MKGTGAIILSSDSGYGRLKKKEEKNRSKNNLVRSKGTNVGRGAMHLCVARREREKRGDRNGM